MDTRSYRNQSKPAAGGQSTLRQVKARQQGAWSSGDYAVVGTTLQIVGEELCEALDLRVGSEGARRRRRQRQRLARRGAPLVRRGRRPTTCPPARTRPNARRGRAPRSRVPGGRCRGTAVPDGSFDVVDLHLRRDVHARPGAAPPPNSLRVCKRGGKIGLANWTPDGFIGQLFKTIGKHLPPPAGAKSPALWGTRARLSELFGAAGRFDRDEARHFVFRYRSPEHWLDVFKTYYGPVLKAFAALDGAGAAGSCGAI